MLSPHLIAELGRTRAGEDLPDASGMTFHSGRVRPGDAFFALPGAAHHGIVHADAALAAGAAFVVSDRPHPRGILVDDAAGTLLALGRHARAALSGPVVGITGSAGKTSTKAMVAAAAAAHASPGNMNTPYALAQVLVDAWLGGRTSEGDVLVLEMGIDHTGEMDVLVDLVRPTHGILTLIAPSHLSGLGSVEGVAREKSRLLHAAAYALASSETLHFLDEELTERAHTYGLEGDAPVPHAAGRIDRAGAERQTLEYGGVRFDLPYPGVAMARNAICALALAEALGTPVAEAARRLERVRLEPGRLAVTDLGSIRLVDDAYNSNPASVRMALDVLALQPRPHVAILGDMLELGDDSERHHRELGRMTRGIDLVLAVGDQARFVAAENPAAQHVPDADAALERLGALDLRGSVLVKASRGMRLERVAQALRDSAERPAGAKEALR